MTIATISKEFSFSASHQLVGLPEEHPCSRLHGHNYIIRVSITGEVVTPGFVVDYRSLDPIKHYIDDTLDHRHLNEVLPGNPTAENMAAILGKMVQDMLSQYTNVTTTAVSVSETPKTWATVTL